jgi:hypothetical protein
LSYNDELGCSSLSALILLLLVIPLNIILVPLGWTLLGIVLPWLSGLLLVVVTLSALVLLVARIVRHVVLLFCGRVSLPFVRPVG